MSNSFSLDYEEVDYIVIGMGAPHTIDALSKVSDEAWKDIFGEYAFEVAIALQASAIESICTPGKGMPEREELEWLLLFHRRVRRLDSS